MISYVLAVCFSRENHRKEGNRFSNVYERNYFWKWVIKSKEILWVKKALLHSVP